jgi:hypothetical protein
MLVVLLLLLQRFEEAANSFYEGVKLDPENKELVNAFRYWTVPLSLDLALILDADDLGKKKKRRR